MINAPASTLQHWFMLKRRPHDQSLDPQLNIVVHRNVTRNSRKMNFYLLNRKYHSFRYYRCVLVNNVYAVTTTVTVIIERYRERTALVTNC